MKQLLTILVFITLFSFSGKGQTYFNTDFESDTNVWYLGSNIYALQDTSGYVAIGNMPKGGGPNYISFLRLNNIGDTLYTKEIGKFNYHVASTTGKLISLGDTQFVFTGYSFPDSMQSVQDSSYIKLMRVDINGNVIWEKEYGDNGKQNVGYDIQQTKDKGFIISGYTDGWGTLNSYNSFLLKVDSLGNEEWHQIYGGGNRDAYSVDTTSDGGYVIAGSLYSPATDIDINVVKTDSLGNVIWSQYYGTPEEDNPYAYITKYGNTDDYILVGSIDIVAGNILEDFQGYIARINGLNGNIIWADTLGIIQNGVQDGFTSNTIILPTGDIIGVGRTYYQSTTGSVDAWIIKYDENGNKLWQRAFNKYGGNNWNYFYDVHQTVDKGFIICGNLTNLSQGTQNLWVLKLDSMGCEIPNCSVGIDENSLQQDDVVIYPNPTHSTFNIALNEQPKPNTIFKLFDITGKEVYSQSLKQSITSIEVCAYPKGVYIYKIVNNNETYSGKLVVD